MEKPDERRRGVVPVVMFCGLGHIARAGVKSKKAEKSERNCMTKRVIG